MQHDEQRDADHERVEAPVVHQIAHWAAPSAAGIGRHRSADRSARRAVGIVIWVDCTFTHRVPDRAQCIHAERPALHCEGVDGGTAVAPGPLGRATAVVPGGGRVRRAQEPTWLDGVGRSRLLWVSGGSRPGRHPPRGRSR